MEDHTVQFLLRHSEDEVRSTGSPSPTIPLQFPSSYAFTPSHWREGYDAVQEKLRADVWATKARLDPISDEDYLAARNRVFSHAVGGGRRFQFTNRAGFKLLEVVEAAGVWDLIAPSSSSTSSASKLTGEDTNHPSPSPSMQSSTSAGGGGGDEEGCSLPGQKRSREEGERNGEERSSPSQISSFAASSAIHSGGPVGRVRRKKKSRGRPVTFVDLCGGPGSFAQALFSEGRRRRLRLRGYGMTLGGVDGLDWYPELSEGRHREFTVTYGPDGSGDIFKLSNVDALASIAGLGAVHLVVADGGFHVSTELSNYQETISSHITYAQWFTALKLQAQGGCFVLKLFDSFSPLTRAMLYLSTFMYRKVWIVKPLHSRVVNSERYLVCTDFCGIPSGWLSHFQRCFVEGFESEEKCVPTLLPNEWVLQDKTFMSDLEHMNDTIAKNQILALERVLEEVYAKQDGSEHILEGSHE